MSPIQHIAADFKPAQASIDGATSLCEPMADTVASGRSIFLHGDQALALSILMPCLNEALTLATCISKARHFLDASGLPGEVLVADNGSTDGSQDIARRHGARVIDVPRRGYGAALRAGIEAARGRWVAMADSDDSYDFEALGPFVEKLANGAELVMGNRFSGGIRPGAMPALHRYLGNPILSGLGRLFFKLPIRDFHCGLRAFDRQSILALNLCCDGMEFASEMVVKASLHRLKVVEVPTVLSPDGRDRPPHLRSWRDGWRHLRFLLLFSPRWLFLYPGAALLLVGALTQALLLSGPLRVGAIAFDVHTMLYGAAACIAGLQMLMFAVFTKVFAVEQGVLPHSGVVDRIRRWLPFERGLLIGLALLGLGLGLSVYSVLEWERLRFGAFDPTHGMRIVIPSMTLAMTGVQVIFTALFLAVLDLRTHGRARLG